MDWPSQREQFLHSDFGIFHYQSRETIVIARHSGSRELEEQWLKDDADWDSYFHRSNLEFDKKPQFEIVILDRAPDILPGVPAPLSYLSLSFQVFKDVVSQFRIQSSITRVAARQAAYLAVTACPGGLSFTARMSSALPDDIALAATFNEEDATTRAIVFGANEVQRDEILQRLQEAGDTLAHPFVVAGIFVELERDRLVARVEDLLDGFTLGADVLERRAWENDSILDSNKTREHLSLCIQSRNLVDHMRAVKRQIAKLIKELDRFQNRVLEGEGRVTKAKAEARQRFEQLQQTGSLVSSRLREILDEYDDKIDECRMIVDNMSIAMQTVFNRIARYDSKINMRMAQDNTRIALSTTQDNAQMRSIALLTMIFLPLSTVASIFSMTIFNWQPTEGQSVVSTYIWVFIVLSAGLTILTVSIWYLTTNKYRKQAKEQEHFDYEKMA